MQVTDIITAIMNGECDGNEDAVYSALNTRIRQQRAVAKLTNSVKFKIGDRVRLCGLTPKVLNGSVVTIVAPPAGKRATKAKFYVVSDTNIAGRIFPNVPVRIPTDCVEAL